MKLIDGHSVIEHAEVSGEPLIKTKSQTETHDKRTITHECVKDTHDKLSPSDSEKPNNCETCKHDSKEWYEDPCGWCCGAHSGYEPKTEPQTEMVTDCHRLDEPQIIACPIQEEDADYARWLYEDEPQTERSE